MRKLLASVWGSFARTRWPRTDLDRSVVVQSNFFLHLHPVKVKRHGIRFTYTFGLGGAALLLFVVLVLTGVVLMLYYTPHPKEAYRSMKDLDSVVTFGRFLRNLHRWSAHAMVVVVIVHMARVFFTGAYRAPRQFNWCVGVTLLFLTLGLSFTGYLLPWDQLAFWAVTVGTSLASYVPVIGDEIRLVLQGGTTINQVTLLRFYIFHCVVLPLIMILLLAVHFWRVRKDGGISAAEPEPEGPVAETRNGRFPPGAKTYGLMSLSRGEPLLSSASPDGTVFTWPHLVYRELLYALLILVLLWSVSMAFDAPLEPYANPSVTPNPAKAPWYFLGLQELVHYSALLGGVLVPAFVAMLLYLVPYIDRNPRGVGVWFHRSRWKACSAFAAGVLLWLFFTVIGTYFRGENWTWVWPW